MWRGRESSEQRCRRPQTVPLWRAEVGAKGRKAWRGIAERGEERQEGAEGRAKRDGVPHSLSEESEQRGDLASKITRR